jgi:hypothetical protein
MLDVDVYHPPLNVYFTYSCYYNRNNLVPDFRFRCRVYHTALLSCMY